MLRTVLRVVPVAFVVALVVPVMTPSHAAASPVDQQRQRVADIVDELERLEEQANRIAEDYVEAIDTKSLLDEEIAAAEERVARKADELDQLRANLGEMALRSFVGSGGTPLGPLFEETSDLNDVLQREELARVALSAGNVTTDELDALVDELEEERADLEAKRAEAEQLAQVLQGQQAETERLTEEYTTARAEAEAELGRLIAEEEERRARESAERLAREAAAAEAEARAQAQAAAESGSSGGGGSGGTSSGGGGGSSSGSSGGGGGTSSGGGGSSSGSSSGGGGSSSSSSSGGGGSSSGSSGGGGGSSSSSGGGYSAGPAVSSLAGIAVNAALAQQGTPYRWATSSPGVGFDCSGLTSYAWAQAGVYLPHQSRAQYASTPRVSSSAAKPGDLLFYYSPISHVGIYLGGGQMVHAPNTGSVVHVTSVNWGKVTGVGRPG